MSLQAAQLHARVCRIYEALVAPALGAPRLAAIRNDGIVAPPGASWGLVDARACPIEPIGAGSLNIVAVGPGDAAFEDISVSLAVGGRPLCGPYAFCLSPDGFLLLAPEDDCGAWYVLGRRQIHRLRAEPLSSDETLAGSARAAGIVRRALMRAA